MQNKNEIPLEEMREAIHDRIQAFITLLTDNNGYDGEYLAKIFQQCTASGNLEKINLYIQHIKHCIKHSGDHSGNSFYWFMKVLDAVYITDRYKMYSVLVSDDHCINIFIKQTTENNRQKKYSKFSMDPYFVALIRKNIGAFWKQRDGCERFNTYHKSFVHKRLVEQPIIPDITPNAGFPVYTKTIEQVFYDEASYRDEQILLSVEYIQEKFTQLMQESDFDFKLFESILPVFNLYKEQIFHQNIALIAKCYGAFLKKITEDDLKDQFARDVVKSLYKILLKKTDVNRVIDAMIAEILHPSYNMSEEKIARDSSVPDISNPIMIDRSSDTGSLINDRVMESDDKPLENPASNSEMVMEIYSASVVEQPELIILDENSSEEKSTEMESIQQRQISVDANIALEDQSVVPFIVGNRPSKPLFLDDPIEVEEPKTLEKRSHNIAFFTPKTLDTMEPPRKKRNIEEPVAENPAAIYTILQ